MRRGPIHQAGVFLPEALQIDLKVVDQGFFFWEAVVEVPDCGAVGLDGCFFRDDLFGFAADQKEEGCKEKQENLDNPEHTHPLSGNKSWIQKESVFS